MRPLNCLALVALFFGCWFHLGCGPAAPEISLQQAVEQGDLKAVQQHIAAKTDLNSTDAMGWTALHKAVMKGNLAIVQALAAGGADTTRKGPAGKTALDLARDGRQAAIVQLLQQPGDKAAAPQSGRGLIDGGLGVSETLNQ
jgi:ankyrin repeat protein